MTVNRKDSSSEQNTPSEEQLLKAMEDLENAAKGLRKGDDLENRDTEGGMSTQGERLSKKKKTEKSNLAKKFSSSDMDSSEKDDDEEGEDEDEDEEEEEDDDEEEEEAPPAKKSKMGKSLHRPKSLSERAHTDSDLQKGMDASGFLESFVRNFDQMSEENRQAISDEIRKSDMRTAGAHVLQQRFNLSLAKSQVAQGKALSQLIEATERNNELLEEHNDLLKSLGAQPVSRRENRDTSNRANPREPERGGQSRENDALYPQRVSEWLTKKSLAGEVASEVAMYYESNGYDWNLLRDFAPDVAKQCENDLRKSA